MPGILRLYYRKRKGLLVPDTIPNDNFSFSTVSNAMLSATIESNTINITGINTATPISITNGKYKINNNAFVNTNGFINNNNSLTVQGIASSNYSTNNTVTVNIGVVQKTFTITTMAQPVINYLDTFDTTRSGAVLNNNSLFSPLAGASAYCNGLSVPKDGNIYYWETNIARVAICLVTSSSSNIIAPASGGIRCEVQWMGTFYRRKIYTTTSGTSGSAANLSNSYLNIKPAVHVGTDNTTVQLRLKASEFQYQVTGLPLVAG